jgi:hypothetical protein
MKIYWKHPETGEFVMEGLATESPLEPGVFAIPADAVTTAPPDAIEGHVRIWVTDTWQQVEDHRGETFWTRDGQEVAGELGPVPDDLLTEKPFTLQPKSVGPTIAERLGV